MRRGYFSFYLLIVILNVLPFIPLSVKGICGLICIIIACIKTSLKDGLITATLWVLFGFVNFILKVNVDDGTDISTMLIGSALYYITAFYFGTFTQALKNKNKQLVKEIEKRKEVERQLNEKLDLIQSYMTNEQTIDEILEHEKMQTEFFSNISHELRTPLNVILGSVQLIELYMNDEDWTKSKGKIVRNVGTMKQNCYRLLKLVNNLIDITKIDAKAFEIHLENCNIISTIEEITLSVSDYAAQKGISIVFDTEIEEKIMACDDEKIERILLNLLSNAIKFTPDGGDVFVNVYDLDGGISIKVEDRGIGIPADKQSQIFKRFFQVDEMFTRQNEGSGIGLSLVKSLVEMHGGAISFESKEGIGTSFVINLPLKEAPEQQQQCSILAKQAPIERINVEFSDIYGMRCS